MSSQIQVMVDLEEEAVRERRWGAIYENDVTNLWYMSPNRPITNLFG
jgi:hypothetical protein